MTHVRKVTRLQTLMRRVGAMRRSRKRGGLIRGTRIIRMGLATIKDAPAIHELDSFGPAGMRMSLKNPRTWRPYLHANVFAAPLGPFMSYNGKRLRVLDKTSRFVYFRSGNRHAFQIYRYRPKYNYEAL